MSRTAVAISAIALTTPLAGAELVEMTISGTSASQHGLYVPGTTTLLEIDEDWSFTIIYNTADSLGSNDLDVVDAWMTVGGDRRNLDLGHIPTNPFSPPSGYLATQTVDVSPLARDGGSFVYRSLEFNLGAEGGTSVYFASSSMFTTLKPVDLDELINIHVDYSLEDMGPLVWFDAGEGSDKSDSTVWSRGGAWNFYATSFSARVIPTPSALLALGGAGLLSARRRR